MQDDDSIPTLRPPSKRSSLSSIRVLAQRIGAAHEITRTIFAAIVAAGAGVGMAAGYVQQFATDDEVERALNKHDHGYADPLPNGEIGAHPSLRSQVTDLRTQLDACNTHATQNAANDIELWAVVVRLTAADAERDPRLRLAAGAFYEREFRRLVARGAHPDDAHREVLRMPWLDRPRTR